MMAEIDLVLVSSLSQRLWIGLKSDPELYEWLDDIYAKCPLLGVSGPTNFVHQGNYRYPSFKTSWQEESGC
jgi:hypothetical protein